MVVIVVTVVVGAAIDVSDAVVVVQPKTPIVKTNLLTRGSRNKPASAAAQNRFRSSRGGGEKKVGSMPIKTNREFSR